MCGEFCSGCNENGCIKCFDMYDIVDSKCECLNKNGCDSIYGTEAHDEQSQDNSLCGKGYFLAEQDCKKCTQGCSECESIIICKECYDGFYYSSGFCYEKGNEKFSLATELSIVITYLFI